MHMGSQSLDEVLASTGDILFPASLGRQQVTIDSRSSDGDTPLHVVVWRGDTQAVRLLLAAGADVNAQGDMGYTPLHVAISREDLAMMKLLLDSGARTDLTAEIAGTARDEAMRRAGPVAEVFANHDLSHPNSRIRITNWLA
jgi:ankyrin repeat protein